MQQINWNAISSALGSNAPNKKTDYSTLFGHFTAGLLVNPHIHQEPIPHTTNLVELAKNIKQAKTDHENNGDTEMNRASPYAGQ